MRKLMAAAAAALMLVGAVGEASAAVNIRQINQQRRIDAGVRSPREAARLRAEQRSIRVTEARARARHGGRLTRRDKAAIHARQDMANRDIVRLKHNGRRGRNHLHL